ncbi:MAG: phosphatidylserine/phosphatidylglycerophosphate/cardiolipin synthase family protein [Ktedonobacteraceae bacterium]|nr:phosphatidylserine/phosphatidylglycerophosphate/cardiolipin synthase family protein [Ktedonobacteraceae bacterium]
MKESRARQQLKSLSEIKGRLSLARIVRFVLSVIFALQAVTVSILWIVTVLRNRYKKQERSFPRIAMEEVQVGENRLQLYCYGRDLYDAMLAAIDSARETIYLESYIWKGDAVGQEFKEHLARKAAEGVEVYVIFDGFANLVVPREFKDPASFHPAIHVLEYHSFARFWHILDPRRYGLDHRKILAVDGKIGFIGGYNIGSLYATSWRDTHLRVCGPAAADLAQSFIDFWNAACPRKDRITRRYTRKFDPLITLRDNNALRLIFPIRDMYIENIDRAERSIWLTNAYFVPDHFLLKALKDAAGRGVDVRILIPWISNHFLVDWVSHGYFTECLRAGIRIFGYRHTMLHAKTCTIDGQWSTVGTANLDRLSSIGNFEINIEVYSPELARQMEALFACDTADMFELTLENWRNRPWLTKVSERILAPLRFII